MAKKNYTPNPDGRSAEDRALDKFAELMIEKITNLQSDWKKPWFSPQAAQLPRNLNGRQYNGMNSIILMLQQEKNGWKTARYATFDRITGLNYGQQKTSCRVWPSCFILWCCHGRCGWTGRWHGKYGCLQCDHLLYRQMEQQDGG